MYTEYYGFRDKPFALSPDPRFLYLSEAHREVLGHLVYGIEQGEGFMAITGEVGTGKTTLCRTLLRRLGKESEVAFLFNPTLTPLELLKGINAEFGLSTYGESRPELTDVLNTFLLEQKAKGRRVLLIIDEAQNLSIETLEQLRLLSNLETETSKLLQIVLLGQPELEQKLDTRELRQLRQRISVWWHLGPLSAKETREYVCHRLRVAGSLERPIFTQGALRAIHRMSRGVPRLVNVLCDRALLAGYAEQHAQIGRSLATRVAGELRPKHRAPGGRRNRAWLAAASGAGAALLAVGLLALRAPGPHSPESAGVAAAAGVAPLAIPPLPAVSAPPEDDAPFVLEVAPSEPEIEETTGAVLDTLLPLRGVAESRAGTLDAALAAWRLPPSGADALELSEFLARLDGRRLRLLPLEPELEALRQLGQPAIVSLRSSDGVARLALVRALADERADLEGVLEGQTVRVSLDELSRHLDGEIYAVWRDFEALPPLLRPGDAGEAIVWLQGALADLGYYPGPRHGRYDDATAEGVMRFQAQHGLVADAVVGPRTQLRLYEALPSYATPSLSAEPLDVARTR